MARFSSKGNVDITRCINTLAFKGIDARESYGDWKEPNLRKELFNRYFKWRVTVNDLDHTHYMNVLCKDYDYEQKAWFAFTFGMTYRTPQSFAYTETFPDFHAIDMDELEKWHAENWKRTTYGTDARYNKGHFVRQVQSLKDWVGGKTFKEKFDSVLVGNSQRENFWLLYREVLTLYKFGRMTGWLTMQALYDLLGLPIDPDDIMLDGYSPNNDSSLQSIWNGLCAYENRHDMMVGKYGSYSVTDRDTQWAKESLLEYTSLAEEFSGFKIDSFRKESIWCQYKRLFGDDGSKEYPGHACLVGETKISLLDGTEVEIKDLVGRDSFWLFSCTKDGEIVPGFGHSARITKYVNTICEIHLDNGEIIKSTIDHRFMLRDGSYKEAKDLQLNDSLMPLYRSTNKNGYTEYKDNASNSYKLLYQTVANSVLYEQRKEVSDEANKNGYSQLAIHHKNHDKKNDDPNNLTWISAAEHLAHHREEFQKTEAGIEMMSRLGKMNGPINIATRNKSEEGRLASRNMMTKLHQDEEFNRRCGENGKRVFDELWNDDNFVKAHKERASLVSISNNKSVEIRRLQNKGRALKSAKHVLSLGLELNEFNYNANKLSHSTPRFKTALSYFNSFDEFHSLAQMYNHTVKEVRIISCAETPVYDITVDHYHNFALTAGVFVHNSGDATSRYLYYREFWPEIDWSKFREALRTQPGYVKGATFVDWYNSIFGATGLMINMNEMFDDMPNVYDLFDIDPSENKVIQIWEDDGLVIEDVRFSDDLLLCPRYVK